MGEDLDRSSPHKKSPATATISSPGKSVHCYLGGSTVADLLLWKRPLAGVSVLLCTATAWFLFEQASYSFLSSAANVILISVVILFLWAKSALLLSRPLPRIPNLEISEESVEKAADAGRIWINGVLAFAHYITTERDMKLFFEVVLVLWFVQYIGRLANFLTVVHIGVILSFTLPVLYDKYRDCMDEILCAAQRVLLSWYRKFDDAFLSKVLICSTKQKKIQ